MLKEIRIFVYLLIIFISIFFSIKFYISDANKKKSFRNLNSVDDNIKKYETRLPIIINDTDNVVQYLNDEDNSSKKKYSFWELLND